MSEKIREKVPTQKKSIIPTLEWKLILARVGGRLVEGKGKVGEEISRVVCGNRKLGYAREGEG